MTADQIRMKSLEAFRSIIYSEIDKATMRADTSVCIPLSYKQKQNLNSAFKPVIDELVSAGFYVISENCTLQISW